MQDYGIIEPELILLVCNIFDFSQLLKHHYFEVLLHHKTRIYEKDKKRQQWYHDTTPSNLNTNMKRNVSDTLFSLHIEEQEGVHDLAPLHCLQHFNTGHIHYIYRHLVYTLYKHKAKQKEQIIKHLGEIAQQTHQRYTHGSYKTNQVHKIGYQLKKNNWYNIEHRYQTYFKSKAVITNDLLVLWCQLETPYKTS